MPGPEYYGMDPTERATMLDAARGLTAQESADKHGVTIGVIHDRRRKIKIRLNAKTISHAVALTMALGYLDDNEILRWN